VTTKNNYSYWEIKQYFRKYDLLVIGSGIVGLSAAISFKKKNKKAHVMILERGLLPDGASTKNAGFACFGSPGELLADLNSGNPLTVWETVAMRYEGLQILKKRLGEKNIGYEGFGGYELFPDKKKFELCLQQIPILNQEIRHHLGLKNCYVDATSKIKNFAHVQGVLKNRFEGQIDTGSMMHNLICYARQQGVTILNNVHVVSLLDSGTGVTVQSSAGDFTCSKTIVATNGFASQLIKINDLKPARAQVLVTAPINNLKLKGTFTFDEGYYYFRNINGRILFGGGRNLDVKKETTTVNSLNKRIQNNLEHYLQTMILPGKKYEVAHRWTGIMGIGKEKKPIIKFKSKNILVAVRMGGMGIAIGSWVGQKAAQEIV
jgi:glycine/D-amino acid oxidase-like deaminating enzyme